MTKKKKTKNKKQTNKQKKPQKNRLYMSALINPGNNK